MHHVLLTGWLAYKVLTKWCEVEEAVVQIVQEFYILRAREMAMQLRAYAAFIEDGSIPSTQFR